MITYTKSATLDTFDFIKKILYYLDIIIQVFYIGYIGFRLYSGSGIFIINITLLVITGFYFIYYLATNREFYTAELKKQREVVREVVRWVKRAIYIYLITTAIYQLAVNPTPNDNMAIIMTLLMIVGFLSSLMFDLTIKEINRRIKLLTAAALYDIEIFQEEHKAAVKFLKVAAKLDIEDSVPKVEDEKMIARLKAIHHEQTHKAVRRKVFHGIHLSKKKK